MVNFGLLTAEIRWRVWGTRASFNSFRVLAALGLLHSTLETSVRESDCPGYVCKVYFQLLPRLGSVTARHVVVGVSQTLRR